MKVCVALCCLSLTSAFAANLQCEGRLNGQVVLSSDVTTTRGAGAVPVGEVDLHEVFITELANGRFELQAYNVIEPSRSYASAALAQSGDSVELTIWKREFWVDVKCSLR